MYVYKIDLFNIISKLNLTLVYKIGTEKSAFCKCEIMKKTKQIALKRVLDQWQAPFTLKQI